MRPVIEKERFGIRYVIYIIIVIICIIGIGVSVYIQFFRESNIGVIFGITCEEEDTELKSLKEDFLNIFDNSINILAEYTGSVTKIRKDEDLIIEGDSTRRRGRKLYSKCKYSIL